MLDMVEVSRLAKQAMAAALQPGAVLDVQSEPTTGSVGEEALQLTVVLHDDLADGVSGDQALDALDRLLRDLQNAGDGRFPIISYLSESEAQAGDDPES